MIKKTCSVCFQEFQNQNANAIRCSLRCRNIYSIYTNFEKCESLAHATALYDLKTQGYCHCCFSSNNRYKSMVVDHCHKTQKIRGVICKSCNQTIGKFENGLSHNMKQHHYKYLGH